MERKKKRLIVNVGSFAGFAPTPVYPHLTELTIASCHVLGLKSIPGSMVPRYKIRTFFQKCCRSTSQYLHHILILTVDAYLVTTKLAKIRRPNIITPTENAFVKAALNNIGRDSSPYWSHM
jgi:hypothetical protein